ncbi:MAG: hypothetical protein ACI4LD_10255 [Lentihominibacter sp.]
MRTGKMQRKTAKPQHHRTHPQSAEKTERARTAPDSNSVPVNREHQAIREWLQQVKFRDKFIGGVDEMDVWKKIDKLNTLYEKALAAERARYDALLERQKIEFKAFISQNLPPKGGINGKKG